MQINEIKQRLSIQNVLSHYNLKPDRKNLLKCPFHKDKTPSFQIYPKTNTWTCFSSNCTAGSGDVIDFIMLMENCTKHQAIIKAKEMIQPGYTTKPAELSRIAVMTKLFKIFQAGLQNSPQARDYLKSRNLDELRIEVGYNSGQFHHVKNYGNQKQFIESCVKHRALKQHQNGYRSFAKNCIIFPLKNKSGKIVSFYGRSITNNESSKHYYLQDRHGLYPGYPPPETKILILTESIIDAATLLQLANLNGQFVVLALYGTNGLTTEHKQALQSLKNLQEIIFAFDGDEAGAEATVKYEEELRELLPEVQLSTMMVPQDTDINSLSIGHDPEIFLHLIEQRLPLLKPSELEEAKKELFSSIEKEKKCEGVREPEPAQSHLDASNSSYATLRTENPEFIIFETPDLKITIWGGIDMHQVKRLRATLHIQVKGNSFNDFRDTVDLYSHSQADKLIKLASEKLEVSTTIIARAITDLTKKLENYRHHYREARRKQEEERKKAETDRFSRQQMDKAEKFLQSKQLTKKTYELFKKIGLVGQQKNGMLLFYIYLTRMFKNPLHAIIMGSSASGKTHLLKGVAKLVPRQHIKHATSLSENTLYYSRDSWKHCILLVEDLDGAYNALLPLREFMSNYSISRYSTRTNKLSGEIEQIYLHVEGPVSVAGATTKERIYEDNANRSFLIYVTEKAQHVNQVLEYQRKFESGLIDMKQEQEIIGLLKAAQLHLRPVEVIIPFGEELRIPEYVFKKLRTNKHYITLIKSIAFWNQKQRKWYQKADGTHFIEATIEDVEWANFLCKEALLRKSDELNHALRDFFETLKAYVKQDDPKNITFYVREIQKNFRLYPMKVNRYLKELVQRGYIQRVGGNHKTSYEYRILVWDDYEILQKGLDILDEILEKIRKKDQKTHSVT